MKVSELPYQRVTIEQFQAVMRGVVDRIRRAGNVEEILAAREDYLGIMTDRKSTRLNSSHTVISYAVFCLKKKFF